MKKSSLLVIAGLLSSGFLYAQCCNVVTSNNVPVTTSNGVCVSLMNGGECPKDVQVSIIPAVDSDNDGTTDDLDKCPTTPGTVSNKGCPVITEEIWTLFYSHLRDVKFAYNSDSLTSSSYAKLDNVVKLMKDNNYILKVSGYADSVGTTAYNKNLSKKRAMAVENYLEKKGVDKDRVIVAAYGEKFPEVSNETEKGRAKNRRVEFDLLY